MHTEVVDASTASIARAAALLAAGEVVAFPTETVYGLGARADDGEAVKKIFVAKGRPSDKPLILHAADTEQAKSCTTGWDERAQALADAFWPGPLSIVMKAADWIAPEVLAGGDTVAVRPPGHEVALALVRACGVPIAAPSANRSGAEPPTTAQGVLSTLDGRIPMVVDGGETPVRVPSTLISLVGEEWRILREGAIPSERLRAMLGPWTASS